MQRRWRSRPASTIAGYGMKGLMVLGAGKSAISGVKKIVSGDIAGGLLDIGQAGAELHNFRKSCFRAGTLVYARGRWGLGWRQIELITTDDEVLSRNEEIRRCQKSAGVRNPQVEIRRCQEPYLPDEISLDRGG